MTKECFKKQTDILLAVFGGISPTKVKLNIWYDLLSDIDDKNFEEAIKKVCNEVKDVYPSTNIVALIRSQIEPTSRREKENFI